MAGQPETFGDTVAASFGDARNGSLNWPLFT
jgi:hypothetical protein